MQFLGKAIGAIAKAAPRVVRGIGEAAKVSRAIGQGARQVRQIGTALNSATGNKLQNNPLYNKALGVTERVENVADQVGSTGEKFGSSLKQMGY
jgi:hypothetical protein